MGGHAFDPERLSTPRMPPEIYHNVKSRLLTILRQHFRLAAVPIEAPAKLDHGDIDILVKDPINPTSAHKPEHLASLVGAKHWKRGGDTINLAIPWPTTTPTLSNSSSDTPSSAADDDDPGSAQKYIQIDIAVLPSRQKHKWLLFLHSHGDLWSILGSVLRPYGLLVTPGGFYVHIPEIRGENKNLSRVKVSDEAGEVLRYLGLDEERYWDERGFGDWDELLGYLATGRFGILGRRGMREMEEREKEKDQSNEELGVSVEVARVRDLQSSDGDDEDDGAETPAGQPTSKSPSGQEKDDTDLKANDRQRASKRPFFAYYLYTYLPNLLKSTSLTTTNTTTSSAKPQTKEEVILSLKSHFGPSFTSHYDSQREKGMRVIGEQKLWSSIREVIKSEGGEGSVLGYGMKGVKAMIYGEEYAWVEEGGEEQRQGEVEDEGVTKLTFPSTNTEISAVRSTRLAFRSLDYHAVLAWAEENWRTVGETQKRIDEEKSRVLMLAKTLKGKEKEREMHELKNGQSGTNADKEGAESKEGVGLEL